MNKQVSKLNAKEILKNYNSNISMDIDMTKIKQDYDDNDPHGYQIGPKSAKELAKEAVGALHEPDHWQRYIVHLKASTYITYEII